MYHWDWMKNEHALAVAEWTYDAPLTHLNIQEDENALDHFLNPFNWRNRFAVFKEEALIGYVDFRLKSEAEAEVYLQLHPELLGQGEGIHLAREAMGISRKQYDLMLLIARPDPDFAPAVRLCEKLDGKRKTNQEKLYYEWTFTR
ncbi:GNAT family N-acetyltransferase [Salisediminibacterium selenitireducens]|nr:hypothetical protein [Salisediminibacterium selenitireducens]